MPNSKKSNPIMITNQITPPLRKSHAALPKSNETLPTIHDEEYAPTRTAATTKTSPSKISDHLFIVNT